MKIGAITIGQAPRTDVTADILHIFDDSLELALLPLSERDYHFKMNG